MSDASSYFRNADVELLALGTWLYRDTVAIDFTGNWGSKPIFGIRPRLSGNYTTHAIGEVEALKAARRMASNTTNKDTPT